MAKTIITSSIKIHGIGKSDNKTVFTIKEEREKSLSNFIPLTKISKRTLAISYEFVEDEEINKSSFFTTIPDSDNEETIKDFILEQINNDLLV